MQFICYLDIFPLISQSDIVSNNELTLIHQIHMTSLIKTMMSVLKVLTYIITKLAVILVIMSVLTFKSLVILYIIT